MVPITYIGGCRLKTAILMVIAIVVVDMNSRTFVKLVRAVKVSGEKHHGELGHHQLAVLPLLYSRVW